MDSEVFARIRDYLADQLEVEPEKITPDSDIVNDFGADSLDVIDMITTLSDEFGVEIPDEDIETFHTVGDVVNYLEEQNVKSLSFVKKSVRIKWQTIRKKWSKRSPHRRSTLPSGILTSAPRPNWSSTPA